MDITSEMVRTLRERTGAGLMECKRALEASQGDAEAAVDHLRKQGLKTAEKKAARETGEGRVLARVGPKARVGSVVALTCETDFVARTPDFQKLLEDVCTAVAERNPADADALLAVPHQGRTLGEAVQALVGKIGENMRVARFARLENARGRIGLYVHHDGKKAALVSVTTEAEEGQAAGVLKELCQHIVVFSPSAARREEIPPAAIERERAIHLAEVKSKPPEMAEKIVTGKMEKFFADQVLPEQKWMKDDTQSVQRWLEASLGKGARIEGFARLQVGR